VPGLRQTSPIPPARPSQPRYRLQRAGIAQDRPGAGAADRRAGGEGFLHQGPGHAGKLLHAAARQRDAEIDHCHDPVHRIGRLVIGRRREHRAGRLGPVLGRGDAQGLLGRKVVEEGALGHACGRAQRLHAGIGKAVGAQQVDGGGQQSIARCGPGWLATISGGRGAATRSHRRNIPTGRSGARARRRCCAEPCSTVRLAVAAGRACR